VATCSEARGNRILIIAAEFIDASKLAKVIAYPTLSPAVASSPTFTLGRPAYLVAILHQSVASGAVAAQFLPSVFA